MGVSRFASLGAAGAAVLAVLGAPPVSADPVTKVSLQVTGCEGCRFIAHDGRTWKHAWRRVAVSAPVLDGRTSVTVPRESTPTLSLEVRHPRGYATANAVPYVAFSWTKQDGHWQGGICWGKQKGATARLHIVVTTYRGRPVPGEPKETMIRARLSKLPPKAQAGVQGVPGCPAMAR